MSGRARAFWVELIREYEASGGRPHHEFAHERGVSLHAFRKWLYRLRGDRDGGPAFLPVRVVAPTAPAARWQASGGEPGEIEADLASGVRLRFRAGTDVAYLAELARRLG
jgi:hypothetical protein